MTVAEWLTSTNSRLMLESLRSKVSDRKLRLFATACCRELQNDIREHHCRIAIEAAEDFADGIFCADSLRIAFQRATASLDMQQTEIRPPAEDAAGWVASESAYAAAENVLRHTSQADAGIPAQFILWWRQKRRMRKYQVLLLRDIFGNPFGPVEFDANWRTSTAVALAVQMYESRDFSAMPILADALQDARCDNDDILAHCRGPGAHVRGCWVVDLVLGKT